MGNRFESVSKSKRHSIFTRIESDKFDCVSHQPTRSCMKAILFPKHGGPEVLEYTDAPTPSIRANEVLVRVRACALNHLDLSVRGGLPGVPIPLPHITGSDIAGEIAEIRADVTTMKARLK